MSLIILKKMSFVSIYNSDLWILTGVRLQVRDFLSTNWCSRVRHPHFTGKNGHSRRYSITGFSENAVVAETSHQILEVLSFCDQERV